jgi:hypothetical protein
MTMNTSKLFRWMLADGEVVEPNPGRNWTIGEIEVYGDR